QESTPESFVGPSQGKNSADGQISPKPPEYRPNRFHRLQCDNLVRANAVFSPVDGRRNRKNRFFAEDKAASLRDGARAVNRWTIRISARRGSFLSPTRQNCAQEKT
ncbi:hypothetical protein P0D88_50765, partial [Paraburkholderia sp. RL18-103-BIB-C]|uniref:hypothetical protein n=1 Tax=unclassified Paraburkholderia TaxID=2615204 RepID=UPI0038B73712